jgi:DNA mismatch repair protein MutS2
MSEHALEVLEFERVLERVARRASSELGRLRVRQLRPRTDRDEIVRELARVAAALRFQEERPEWGLGPIPDVTESLEQLSVEGAVCEPLELYRTGELLSTSRLLYLELLSREGSFPELGTVTQSLVDLPEIEKEIRRSVDSEGQVLSSASRELKRVRDGLRGAHSKIVRKLEGYLGTLPERFVVPDASVTIRDGRYVIPVRREGRREVGGIVHDESQTGATLYVEPPISLELMNRVRDLEREEGREIRRILGELTAQLALEHHAVLDALDALVDFDSLDARARAARAWNAEPPEFSVEAERGLEIRDGRHPLLLEGDPQEVVPFDLELSPDEHAMVVSGPNTGGKSVFLKAVGLTSALAQSGVVPAVGAGTRLSVFGSFFADIGDEQSIARNLSTFSAHLANLADIVEEADGTSLVLIDEMGTGTDPAEGAALARSVIEDLVARGATTLVSSHLGELKCLDTEGSGVVNASLQLDSERMEPTYRLVKGRPGRSFGIAIARRLGFPGAVLDRAESYREEGGVELDEVLERLERQEEELRTLVAELEVERATAERLRSEVEGREHSLEEAERTAGGRAQEEARKLLLEARAEVEAAIKQLRGASTDGVELDEAAREARRRVELAAHRHRRPRGQKPTQEGQVGVAAGDPVRIESTGSRGKVLEVRDDRVLVESGALRIEVPVADLARLDREGAADSTPSQRGGWTGYTAQTARTEVDLRGMRVDEMDQALVRAVDEAVVGGLGELRIIHGKGTGALRSRVGELLGEDPRVRDFRTGGPAEGGTGVTVANLR